MRHKVLLPAENDKDFKILLQKGKSRRHNSKVNLKNLVEKISPDNIHKEIDWVNRLVKKYGNYIPDTGEKAPNYIVEKVKDYICVLVG